MPDNVTVDPTDAEGNVSDVSTDEFIVERVVDSQQRKGERYYLIHWQGYSSSEETWEPLGSLTGCLDLVEDFERKRRKMDVPHKSKLPEALLLTLLEQKCSREKNNSLLEDVKLSLKNASESQRSLVFLKLANLLKMDELVDEEHRKLAESAQLENVLFSHESALKFFRNEN